MPRQTEQTEMGFDMPATFELAITMDHIENCIRLEWFRAGTSQPEARLSVFCTGPNELTWDLVPEGGLPRFSSHHLNSIDARLDRVRTLWPVNPNHIRVWELKGAYAGQGQGAGQRRELPFPPSFDVWPWLGSQIKDMAVQLRGQFKLAEPVCPLPPLPPLPPLEPDEGRPWPEPPDGGMIVPQMEDYFRRQARRQEKEDQEAAALEARIREAEKRQKQQQEQRELHRREQAAKEACAKIQAADTPARLPVPPVSVNLQAPFLQFQDTFLPLPDLRGFFLRERAARWWLSNQSDDLLALPYCQIERLDYQLRTALRVIGPLRGRALLSDEVGLGKTIEAGLVIKEYLTRGMIKRVLILTVPSLVDQWEEEMADKFHLACATTNQPAFRADPAEFWRQNAPIIASLHTLKQAAHLAVAQTINWDMLVVDEAHYLRNRASLAWQAVNALPRQFLLLLTATPVQNSLEELYNLVTLLQPGQLPSPREFRARFMNPKRPHQPREPEELRRVLGQIMVRNTRANSGLHLPPRRAETVFFEATAEEQGFWQAWEADLRQQLAMLSPSQASLWGRLLLQTAGSSPAAWQDALASFPNATVRGRWLAQAPLAASWAKKCALVAPLAHGEGGVVIFTQFLHTQAALADQLRAAGVRVKLIHGQTPPPARQPITEAFRREGGALLLTHSGTEGRNLQFCHRLVNFDLPWNPMEIEQRIGRLHRLGQQHPVRIYNLVQQQTLQEHLLEILQEKLNLFELVVGEAGLILGERFSSDEFAEEVFHRWRDCGGNVAEALRTLGEELAAARDGYHQVKQLDDTLFAKDYETL